MSTNNILIKEAELRKLVRDSIAEALWTTSVVSEKLEVLDKNNAKEANDMVRKMYIDYLAKYKPMLKRKSGIEEITIGPYHFKGCMVLIYVDDSQWPDSKDKPCYRGGFRNYSDTQQFIDITFNNAAMKTFYDFRTALLHEFTHLLDSNRDKTSVDQGWYTMTGRFKNTNPITDIIYRLWTNTERNAYTTYSFSKDSSKMKEYLVSLEKKINDIEQYKDNGSLDSYWREVADYLFPDKVKPNTPVSAIKNYFIKKSRHLLEVFKKKCWQRHGQHYDDPNVTPDMKDLNYAADNKKMIDALSSTFLFDCLKMVKDGRTFDDWFQEKKAKYGRLTKKLAKYVWDREIPPIAQFLESDYKDDEVKQNWLRKIGYK